MSTATHDAREVSGYDRRRHGLHNLSRPGYVADPLPYLDAITELGPLFYDEVGRVWVCSGYEESAAVLTDHRVYSSARTTSRAGLQDRGLADQSRVVDVLLEQLLFSDPPDHAAMRKAISRDFTPARVAEKDPSLRAIAEELVDALPDEGPVDLVGDFAAELPARLIATLLDIGDHGDRLGAWADAYERLLGSLSTLPDIADRDVLPVLDEARTVFREVAAQRLISPGDDLLSHMVCGLRDMAPYAPEDRALDITAANGLTLVAGGYQTLTHLVCRGLVLLDENPDQRELLRADHTLVGSAVQEILRIDGSSQYVARRATADTTLCGRHVAAGETVLVMLAAANLDPRTFTDPRRLDIRRQESRHLGFGLGRHYCLGAPYAERLAGWAILAFLDRFDHHLDTAPDAVVWGPHANTRCPARVRVTVHRRAGGTARTDLPVPTTDSVTGQSTGRPTEHPVTAPERHLLTADWNDTSAPLGPHRCWHQVAEHRARVLPDAEAVDDDGRSCSYRELDRRANALAHRLRLRGVEPETVVTLLMERSRDLAVAVLAVAKAGGAFMLVDPHCPHERLAVMIEEAASVLVLVDHATERSVHAEHLAAPVITVSVDDEAETPPVTGVSSGNTAYVVFTSGTTGIPKPIAIDHQGVVNLRRAYRDVFRVLPADRILQFLSLNFDGSVFEIMMALMCGATLVVAPSSRLTVGPPLARVLREQRISIATLTPSVWAGLPAVDLPDLRVAAACGERLPAKVVATLSAPGRRVLNLYGPAETAIWATWHECTPHDDDTPIGRAIANKRLYVADADLRLVPIGEDGELYIGGVGVGRYVGRPELMSELFCHDPFAERPGQLLYRTGDVCRWRSDGVLEYRGRRDRQVKIRGQRVELDEVERVLESAPTVSACAVVAHDQQLRALVVPDGTLDEHAAREFLRARLHSGMIPTAFDVVAELPRTLNNKIDSSVARAVPQTTPPPTEASSRPAIVERAVGPAVEPATETEPHVLRCHWTWRVSRIFGECLRAPLHHIKADSDFFTVGGDSLAIAELLARLERESKVVLDVERLLETPTPAGIAGLLTDGLGAGGA